jgi:hypothetical protein
MLVSDPVDLIGLALVILTIVFAVAVGIRRRPRAAKRRSLRKELDRMSARITALEGALTKLESTPSAPDAPSVPDNVDDDTQVPTAVAVSSRRPHVRQRRLERAKATILVGAMLFLLAIVGLGAVIDAEPVSSSSTTGVGSARR